MTATDPQHNGQPLLDGFIEYRDQGRAHIPLLRVWCRWCCRWHEHGLEDAAPGQIVHRVAHCPAPDSAFEYYVRITDTPFSRVRKALTESTYTQFKALRRGVISPVVQGLRNQPRPVGDFREIA